MTPRLPARPAPPALEWCDVSEPRWHYSSENGKVEAWVECDEYGDGWSWEVLIKGPEYLVEQMRSFIPRASGKCKNADEGKAKVAEWLKANL